MSCIVYILTLSFKILQPSSITFIFRKLIMQIRISAACLILASVILIFNGCEIEESSTPPAGNIYVASFDTSGTKIFGAKIYLDGLLQGPTTPGTLYGVLTGEHIVKVKSTGYFAAEETVIVEEDSTAYAPFILDFADYGQFQFTLDPPQAQIVLDRTLTSFSGNPPYSIEIGPHTVSAFLDGYLTLPPALDSIIFVDPDEVVTVSFNLQQGTIGSSIGNAAVDFTLIDDFLNPDSVSLHDYRGYIVLLTFFYKDCVPCMAEFPEINEVFIDYAQYGVQVMGIDPMYQDDVADVQFVRENLNIQFKLLLDYGYTVNLAYNVGLYPTNIIITPSGEIHSILGGTTKEQLSEIFDEILGL